MPPTYWQRTHDSKHRPPILSAAREFVVKRLGLDLARTLVENNSAAVVAGKPLPSPETSELQYQERNPEESPRRGGVKLHHIIICVLFPFCP